MQIAYNFIMKNGGINSASLYPYKGRQKSSCRYDKTKSIGTVNDYVEIESNNETALMYALNEAGGPLAVAIDASDSLFQNYKSGIYDNSNCTKFPNHAGKCLNFFGKKLANFGVKSLDLI